MSRKEQNLRECCKWQAWVYLALRKTALLRLDTGGNGSSNEESSMSMANSSKGWEKTVMVYRRGYATRYDTMSTRPKNRMDTLLLFLPALDRSSLFRALLLSCQKTTQFAELQTIRNYSRTPLPISDLRQAPQRTSSPHHAHYRPDPNFSHLHSTH